MIDKIDRDTAADNNIVGQRKLSYGEFEHVRLMTLDQYDIKGILFGLFTALLRAQVQGGVPVIQACGHKEGQHPDAWRNVPGQRCW